MKKYILILAAIISLKCVAPAQNATEKKVVSELSAQRFHVIIDYDKKGVVLDLRTTNEINNGYIKGSVQLDFSAKDAKTKIDKLDKTKIYYLYCVDGTKSAEAAAYMEKHEFKRIYILQKGFSDWEQQGLPVEKNSTTLH